MTERYGVERFIRDGGCELEDSDQYGKLWSAGHWGAGKWLELQNSTAEPDGSFKTYFLQVPPHSYSARGAVAWTFDLHEHEYVIETES